MNTIGAFFVRAIGGLLATTWRFEVVGDEAKERLRKDQVAYLYALWHCELLPLVWFHRTEGCTLLVSAHQDGGHVAKAATKWGYELIRGSSTRGGPAALRQVIKALAGGRVVAFTPDGPKGPARRVKPGLVMAAMATGSPIVSVRARASRAWIFRSWDNFVLPKPFAKIRVAYGAPLYVDVEVGRSEAVRLVEGRLEMAGEC